MQNILKTALNKASYNGKAAKTILHLLYLLFIIFSIYKIINEPNIYGKICYSIIIIIIALAIYYAESLKKDYAKAIKQLTMEANPNKANETFKKLIKKEKGSKAYKNSYILFLTLYYLDEEEYQKCITHCLANAKFLKNSIDNLFVYHFSLFFSYYKLNNYEEAKDEYRKLSRLKGTKKLSPLYNWELIEGIYQMIRKEYKQAYNTFKTVNTANMNKREKIQFYVQFAECCSKLKDEEKANNYYQLIAKEEGNSKTLCHAKELVSK